MKVRQFLGRIKQSLRHYHLFYANVDDLLDKASKLLRPLPDGFALVKLSYDNMDQFKCKWNVMQMLSVDGEAWAIVNNDNEIIAWHYGTYRGKDSMFFKVRNCDFEHIELLVDEKYRRNGFALYLLYHTVKNLNPQNIKNSKLGTVIRPDNAPSIKLHELIGFKKERGLFLIHWSRKKNGHVKYYNIPHCSI